MAKLSLLLALALVIALITVGSTVNAEDDGDGYMEAMSDEDLMPRSIRKSPVLKLKSMPYLVPKQRLKQIVNA